MKTSWRCLSHCLKGHTTHHQFGFQLTLRQESVTGSVTLSPHVWHHVCVIWQSDGGVWSIYINGTRHATGVGLAMGYELIGGGTLVIGKTNFIDFKVSSRE